MPELFEQTLRGAGRTVLHDHDPVVREHQHAAGAGSIDQTAVLTGVRVVGDLVEPPTGPRCRSGELGGRTEPEWHAWQGHHVVGLRTLQRLPVGGIAVATVAGVDEDLATVDPEGDRRVILVTMVVPSRPEAKRPVRGSCQIGPRVATDDVAVVEDPECATRSGASRATRHRVRRR